MMRKMMAMLAAGALTACAPMPGPETPAADLPDAIMLSINSWGVNLHHWLIEADGTAIYTYADTSDGTSFMNADQVTKHLVLAPGDYARIVATLSPAEPYAHGESLNCRREITDMPYGKVTYIEDGAQAMLDYDIGCRSDAANPVYDAIAAAREEMIALAADAPEVTRTPR